MKNERNTYTYKLEEEMNAKQKKYEMVEKELRESIAKAKEQNQEITAQLTNEKQERQRLKEMKDTAINELNRRI